VRLLRAEIGPDTPIVQTIFSPLTMANKVIGTTGALQQTIHEHPDILAAALDKMAADVIAFGKACLDAGADGFFFATQLATKADLESDAYERFGVPYDLKVLNALRDGATTTFLHLHGMDPLFELADRYPVDGVNWHDRDTSPTLEEAMTRTTRGLVAGIARRGSINDGTPDAAAAEVRDAIRQTGGRRLIVAPGCVIPDAAPHENLVAARRAVNVTT
jgi:uroporphyrinogen decarboxylase